MRTLTVAALLLLSLPVSAQSSLLQDGKSGRFMFNLHIGPAIAAKDTLNMGAIVLDFGIALDKQQRAYLLFPLQFQFAEMSVSFLGITARTTYGAVMVPIGFQYDFSIPNVKGFYISPRLVGGYVVTSASCNNCETNHAGFIAPELTLKVVLAKRWNVGLVPFSRPIFIGSDNVAIHYRILFFGGANF